MTPEDHQLLSRVLFRCSAGCFMVATALCFVLLGSEYLG